MNTDMLIGLTIAITTVTVVICILVTTNERNTLPKAINSSTIIIPGHGRAVIVILPTGERVLYTSNTAVLLPPLKVEEVK